MNKKNMKIFNHYKNKGMSSDKLEILKKRLGIVDRNYKKVKPIEDVKEEIIEEKVSEEIEDVKEEIIEEKVSEEIEDVKEEIIEEKVSEEIEDVKPKVTHRRGRPRKNKKENNDE
ncbi:MAG: hypothetical protein WC260_01510 [Candidatus Pacearchaeota archaeon]